MSKGTAASRSERALEAIDEMPAPLRRCVHEFGFAIVDAFRIAGIKEARVIRHLVNQVWEGPRQPAQRTGFGGDPVLEKLDWLLVQSESGITAAALIRVLYQNSMVICPREPTPAMVQASIDATGEMGLVSKSEKHCGRLRAAIKASTRQFWPHLLNI